MTEKTNEGDKTVARQPAPARRWRRRLVGGCAALLSLSALGLAGWLYLAVQGHVGGRAELRAELQTLQRGVSANQRQLEQQSSALQARFANEAEQLAAQLQQAQEPRFAALQSELRRQRQQLLALVGTERADWSLAETEYLLRLAQQRLLMAGDVRSALTLLDSAAAIVQKLDDPALHALRAAIVADRLALRGVEPVDTTGIWLRISALGAELDKLPLFALSAPTPEPEPEPKPESGSESKPESATAVTASVPLSTRLRQNVNSTLIRLSGYVQIRRRDEIYEPLLSPQWERLVRQNMRLLLEQSQLALLTGKAELYRGSLVAARRWLADFFALDEASVAVLDAELAALAELPVTARQPAVNASLAAIRVVLNARHPGADVP